MQFIGCLLLVLMTVGPLVGLICLAIVVPNVIRGRIDQPRCPMCGYDEVGRTSDAICPECGLNRHAAELAGWKPRWWTVVAPALAAVVLSIGLIALATHLSGVLLAWTVAWHVAPFLMLAIAGGMYGVRRWPTIACIAIGVPTILLTIATMWQNYHVAFPRPIPPGADLYIRDITQQLGPPLFGVICCGLIGWWMVGIALVLRLRGPYAPLPQPILEDLSGKECGRCGYDLAGLPQEAVCPECGGPRGISGDAAR